VSAAESQTPNGANPPYAVYQVLVRAAGFEPYQADDVMVFDQETSLIEAALQPQRENGISSGEGENG
jgi:hypothetical protein